MATMGATETYEMYARFSGAAALLAVAVVTGFSTMDVLAVDGSRDPVAPSPQDCHVVYHGSSDGLGQMLQVSSQAQVDCDRVGNTAPYGRHVFTSSASTSEGTP